MKTTLLLLLVTLLTGCIPFIDHNGPRRKWYYLSESVVSGKLSVAKAPTAPDAAPQDPGRMVPFEYPPGLFLSDYVWQLEATTNSQHWDRVPFSVDADGVVTVRATQPVMFYRTLGIPKS